MASFTIASLLLAQGVHTRYLTEVLGHSTYRLTMDTCSHVMPAGAATTMDDAFSRVWALVVNSALRRLQHERRRQGPNGGYKF